MAVGGEDDGIAARDALAHGAEELAVLGGGGVADSIRNVDGGGAGLHGDVDHLDEEVEVGAGAVFGGELYVVDEGAGEADGLGGAVEGLGTGDLELGFEVEVGAGEEDVNAVLRGGFEGAGCGFDVLALAAGERGYARAANFLRDGLHGVEVAVRGDGEAGFDDVDAELGKLVGETKLFGVVHGAAGRLLAVAEGGVEDNDRGVGCHGDRPFRLDRIITRSYAQSQMYCAF